MTVDLEVADARAMQQLGVRLAALLQAGDLVVLVGSLGAGKTTLAQGIGAGLGVRGGVTSPTFVIARVHPSQTAGPSLVHVDAYRVEGALEIDDLDLDASVAESVTIVEWGRGLVEGLAPDRLDVEISWTAAGTPAGTAAGTATADGDTRQVRITPYGSRWDAVDLAEVLAIR
jgi:tRNA threonylcarbamoyladenosine biosynthesis protein TsaE